MRSFINYKEKDGKYLPVIHNYRIHVFFYALNNLLPIEKRLSNTEIERISSYLDEVLENPKQTVFSIKELIIILENLLKDGYRTLSFEKLINLLKKE